MTSSPAPLRPSPMRLGDVFATSFDAFKRRFGLFLGLGLLPTVAVMAIALIFILVISLMFVSVFATGFASLDDFNPSAGSGMIGTLILAGILYLVMLLSMLLVQYKIMAMTAAAASDVVQGGTPQFGQLGPQTKGFIGRFLSVALLFVGAVAVISVLMMVLFGAVGLAAFSSSDAPGAAGFVVLVILLIVAELAMVYVAVRLWYLIPVMALERRPGIQSLSRAWQLSRGQFWRLLGYAVVLAVAISVPMYLIYIPTMMPLALSSTNSSDAAAIGSAGLAIVGFLALMLWATLVTPFQVVFMTVVYLDQLRRVGEPLPPVVGVQAPYQPQIQYNQQGYYPYPAQAPGQQYPSPSQYPSQEPSAPQTGWTPTQPPAPGQYPSPSQYPSQEPSAPQTGWTPPQPPAPGQYPNPQVPPQNPVPDSYSAGPSSPFAPPETPTYWQASNGFGDPQPPAPTGDPDHR